MFYDRFKQLCVEKGVKPTNACVEAGVSRGLAAKWKSEKTEAPSADVLKKLSVYFEKSIDEILCKEASEQKENPGTISGTEVEALTDSQRKLIEFAMTVPEEKADMILRVMKSIVEADQ